MPSSLIPTFFIYCFVTAITPGPANLCSLASAMTYGRKQALVQWRGIFTGYAIVAFASSLAVWFLGIVVNKYIYVLTWIGAAYILWLAWHILRSSDVSQAKAGKHCNFIQDRSPTLSGCSPARDAEVLHEISETCKYSHGIIAGNMCDQHCDDLICGVLRYGIHSLH